MPGIEYDTAGLSAGAFNHLDVASTIEEIVGTLAGTEITGAMLGRAGGGARLAAALDQARSILGRRAAAESAARADLGRRAQATAGLGDDLTATTTSSASTGAGSIVEGMSG